MLMFSRLHVRFQPDPRLLLIYSLITTRWPCVLLVEEANNFGLSSAFLVENVFSFKYKFTALVFMD